MKILLNLLPEEKRKDIEKKFHSRFLLWQLFLVFSLEILYVSILVSIYFVLMFQLEGLRLDGEQYDMVHAEQKTLDRYQEKFIETNRVVDVVGNIERNHFSFTKVFLLLDTVIPDGVIVEQMITKNYTVMLTGKAVTRDALLLLDGNLKNNTCVENTNVPLSNLFSQKDVEFQIDFGVKKECLKNNSI